MKIALVAFSGHGKTSFMMSALGKMAQTHFDGVSVDVINGNQVIDKKSLKDAYNALKRGDNSFIKATFTAKNYTVRIKLGTIRHNDIEITWMDYQGGNMIDEANNETVRRWINDSDGAILLYDLSSHDDGQEGVMALTVSSVMQKVNMKENYPVVFAFTKKDLVGQSLIRNAIDLAKSRSRGIKNVEYIPVTAKEFPDTDVALLTLLKMITQVQCDDCYERIRELKRRMEGLSFFEKRDFKSRLKDYEDG